MELSGDRQDLPYGLPVCRQIVNEVSKMPTMGHFQGLMETHSRELREIIESGSDKGLSKYRRMHNTAVDRICLAAVEKMPHVPKIGRASVSFEVRGAVYHRIINVDVSPKDSVGTSANKLHRLILGEFDLPAEGEVSDWIKSSTLNALERSIGHKANSGHANIRIINREMYMLTIRMLPLGTDRTTLPTVDKGEESRLRSEASLVQSGFTPDVVPDDYGKSLFHGILRVPDCGFTVHHPDSLQVSLVTEDQVQTIASGTAEVIASQEWDLLTRAFSAELDVFPIHGASHSAWQQSRFVQLSGAVQAAVRTGHKVIAAHLFRQDAVFIVNPVPEKRTIDAYRAKITNPLMNGWL